MRLAEILSRKSQLAMQQDFIDTFPNDWEFELDKDGGLKVTKRNDGRCWLAEHMFYNPFTHNLSRGEWEEVIRLRLADTERAGLPSISATFANLDFSKGTYCEADVRFKSYADALYFFVYEEGGWVNWGTDNMSFGAKHVLKFINTLHRGTQ
jgi:hypothetical protein